MVARLPDQKGRAPTNPCCSARASAAACVASTRPCLGRCRATPPGATGRRAPVDHRRPKTTMCRPRCQQRRPRAVLCLATPRRQVRRWRRRRHQKTTRSCPRTCSSSEAPRPSDWRGRLGAPPATSFRAHHHRRRPRRLPRRRLGQCAAERARHRHPRCRMHRGTAASSARPAKRPLNHASATLACRCRRLRWWTSGRQHRPGCPRVVGCPWWLCPPFRCCRQQRPPFPRALSGTFDRPLAETEGCPRPRGCRRSLQYRSGWSRPLRRRSRHGRCCRHRPQRRRRRRWARGRALPAAAT
mmetsp:Transcript_11273/g.35028  ORF Transcript_11273/g.35028 Transcript_11273/m.35028 type:complete len:299 (-) Transcript_11273:89-985(-)